jgi:hypothetical protein
MKPTWEAVVLSVLGKPPTRPWRLQDIYGEVEKLPIVTAHHRQVWGSQPNYHHWVRSALAQLKKKRRVKHVGPSTYSL